MNRLALAALLVAVSVIPSMAQDKVWTPAPVPNIGSGDTVQPAARAGDAIQLRDAPFSAVPSGSIAANGATSDNLVNTAVPPAVSPQ